MAANTSPIFVLTPNLPSANIAAANTARDGSGALVTLFTATASGSRVDYVVFTSAQATPALSAIKVCRIFVTDTAGINPRLRAEVLLPSLTPSTTVIGSTATVTFTNGLVLSSGQIVKVAQSVYGSAADATDVFAHGGNY
jgi:hypothetical protein